MVQNIVSVLRECISPIFVMVFYCVFVREMTLNKNRLGEKNFPNLHCLNVILRLLLVFYRLLLLSKLNVRSNLKFCLVGM